MRKLLLFFGLALLLLSSSGAWAQTIVSFPSSRMSVRDALSTVESESGMSIAYNERITDPSKVVSTPSGKTLEEALSIILDGTGTEAVIKGKMILIVKSQPQEGKQLTAPVSGKVRDALGPLAGAVVMNGNNASMTDENGRRNTGRTQDECAPRPKPARAAASDTFFRRPAEGIL